MKPLRQLHFTQVLQNGMPIGQIVGMLTDMPINCCSSKKEIANFISNNLAWVQEKDTATVFLYRLKGTIRILLVHPLPAPQDVSVLHYHYYGFYSKDASHSHRVHRMVGPVRKY